METVIVGERGQVTIPKKLRDRFGIKSKSPVVFELREDGIMIKPAVTVMLREFSEDFIKDVAKADQLIAGERKDILAKWKRR
jgi:AbrB family looped-hinge helix DNA binding protein